MQIRLLALATVFAFWQPMVANALTLSEITAAARLRGIVEGHFLQCSHDANIIVSSTGSYRISPAGQLVWNIETPVQKRIEFTRDGNVKTSDDLRGNQKVNRHAALFAALLRLDAEQLEQNFDIRVSGKISAYAITMRPVNRLGRILHEAVISGRTGGVDSVRLMLASERKIILTLRPGDSPIKNECAE